MLRRMLGFALLLLIGLLIVLLLGAWLIVRALSRPPRKTYGEALAKGDPTEPGELGRSGETVTFRMADGATLPGWIVAGDAPTGPTVLVLHGFGDSRYGALTRVPLLAPHARRVVVFDQRGHGDAAPERGPQAQPRASDIVSVLDQLGDDRGVLFGYSMGAQLAIAAAGEAGRTGDRRIAGVIADGPYRRWRDPVAGTLRCKGLPAEPLMSLAQLILLVRIGRRLLFDRADDAAAMRCPLLVLHGRDDPICPLAGAAAIAEAAADGELVTIDDGTHLDLERVDPERYRDAVVAFFQRLEPGGRPMRETSAPDHAGDE